MGTAACRRAALRAEVGALDAAARVIAEPLPHIDHPGLLVGGTHCGWIPRLTKAGRDCTSPEVVAAPPEEVMMPVTGKSRLRMISEMVQVHIDRKRKRAHTTAMATYLSSEILARRSRASVSTIPLLPAVGC